MSMNLDRHVTAHWDMFKHLVQGDGDSAEKHREFYDEYLAVMDLTAEFYLQTVETVFVKHLLPKGEMTHRGKAVDLRAIRRCAIMAVEGEKDDISGVGQTLAALDLTPNLPLGQEGLPSPDRCGSLRRVQRLTVSGEIVSRIAAFIRAHDQATRRPARAAGSERKRSAPNAIGGHPNGATLRARAQPAQLAPALG